MRIAGLQKLTLIDYPGKIAATVFTPGCSFRCPFCHNPELVVSPQFPEGSIKEDAFFDFLRRRRGKLDGVCITGGEPTIQPDIIEFIERIRALGYVVKLDSNGTRPDVLRNILERKLVDYVAMDIKHRPDKYPEAVGVAVDIERVKLSVKLIMGSGIGYEFRTTVVPGIHQEEDFEVIGQWIRGADAYYLQEFRDGKLIDPRVARQVERYTLDLDRICDMVAPFVNLAAVRRYQ